MGQMMVEGAQPQANIARAVGMINAAGRQNCDVVVLPECLDLGWTHPCAAELAQTIPGPFSDVIVAAAKSAEIYVAAGLVERMNGRIFNTAIFISPTGEILLKHRKINELMIGPRMYSVGNSLAVAETPIGTFGLAICADNFPSSHAIGHVLGRMGARIILSPCAWAVDTNHDNVKDPYGGMWKASYAELAKLYDMSIVGVSNVGWMIGGPWKGRKCIGCSMAIGPCGTLLAQGPYGDNAQALVNVDVPIMPVSATGADIAPMLAAKGYEGG